MKTISKVYGTCVTVVLLSVATPAYAYLDPGTGSALLQGILGALAAIGVAVKLYWYRILRVLGIRKKGPASSDTAETTNNKKEADQGTQG